MRVIRNELPSPSLTMRPRERRRTRPNVEKVESRCEMTMKVDRLRLRRRPVKNSSFCGRIKARSRLIQNQNSRLLQNSSREREPLALSTGKLAGVRSDSLAKAVRQ